MKPSIIIEGPQASGKTLAAEALCKHYGLGEIWDEGHRSHRETIPTTGALVLTNHAKGLRGANGLQVIQVADAFKAAGITLEGLKAQLARKP